MGLNLHILLEIYESETLGVQVDGSLHSSTCFCKIETARL